jgi:hypothetical protein
MISRWTRPQVDSGKTRFRSRSVSTTFFPEERPQRAARRWIWVSTAKVGRPKAWFRTTEAVLWPTPGRAAVLFDEDLGESLEALRLLGGEADLPDEVADLVDGEARHLLRGGGAGEEGGSHLVDQLVRRLRREDDGDQEREGVLMGERDGDPRVECVQDRQDALCFLVSCHDVGSVSLPPSITCIHFP